MINLIKYITSLFKDPYFIVCLLLAVLFWAANRLSNSYTYDMVVPVAIEGLLGSDKYTPKSVVDVDVMLTSRGYQYLRLKLQTRFSNIQASVADVDMERVNDSLNFVIKKNSMINLLRQKLGSEFTIGGINNSVIEVSASGYRQKTLPVVPNLVMELDGEYMVTGAPIIEPCSVIVGGVSAIIDTMNAVYTKHKRVTLQRNNLSDEIDLDIPHSVIASVKKVKYTTERSRYSEKIVNYNVNREGWDNQRVNVIPSQVKLTLNVAWDEYLNFKDTDIYVYIERGDTSLVDNTQYLVKYNLNSPSVKVVDIEPRFVTVLKE